MVDAAERHALLKAIRRLARAIDIQSRRINRELGLTLPQYIVLSAIRDLANGTSREIALAADLSPATVVGILDKLESKGLVERARSIVDRRSVHTRLTEQGVATLARIPFPLGSTFEAAFDALPQEARIRTVAVLNEVADFAAAEATLDESERGPPQPVR